MSLDGFIEAERAAGHSVNRCCELLEVSRSAYYQRRSGPLSARAVSDVELTGRITEIHRFSDGTYGAPRMHRELADRGVHVGRRRVRRLMRLAGIEGRCKRRWLTTTIPDPTAEADAVDLIRRHFPASDLLDARYVGDITYIRTGADGWSYLASVIDLASRRVVGWAVADHMRTELVADALSMAFTSRRPSAGTIFHSDRGVQYRAGDYRRLAETYGIRLSVGRKGQCWDNAVAESFFATIKRELLDRHVWPDTAAVKQAVFDYIEGWYNTRRLHSTLGYMSPANYEAMVAKKSKLQAA